MGDGEANWSRLQPTSLIGRYGMQEIRVEAGSCGLNS